MPHSALASASASAPTSEGVATDTLAATPTSAPAATASAADAQARPAQPSRTQRGKPGRNTAAHALLAELAQRYPKLFGEHPLPLKRGIFQDLVNAHPELEAEALKQALGLHTRSQRYLQAVANNQARRDLQLHAVEPMAAEHSFHALAELYRRKQRRAAQAAQESQRPALQEQAREWFMQRLGKAIERSGLAAQAYAQAIQSRDPDIQAMLQTAIEQATLQAAREQAMLEAFEASGAELSQFAEMYGQTLQATEHMLMRARLRRLPAPDAAPGVEAAPPAG
ncbi:ProQ/FINO family protein [Vandammella animalimorsus]|uniref:ProQ/FINO family protein n=1 Tax=Vandammella animalimorsus TaxID=2029117 RepID=UPI0031BB0783